MPIKTIVVLLTNAFAQLLLFIIVARALGPEGYGVIVSIAVICTIAVEFLGLGCGDLLIKSVASGSRRIEEAIGNAVFLIIWSFPVVYSLGAFFIWLVLDDNRYVFVALLLLASELISSRLLALSEHIAISKNNALLSTYYKLAFTLIRAVVLVVGFFIFGIDDIFDYWYWQFGVGIFASAFIFHYSIKGFGKIVIHSAKNSLAAGFSFSITQAFRAMQVNADRLIIGFTLTSSSLGIYGSAARMMQFSLIPIQALLRIYYPLFFNVGDVGELKKVLRVTSFKIGFVGLICSIFVWIFAPLVEQIIGVKFEGVSVILRGLSPLPLLFSVQYVYGDALSGIGLQKIRAYISIFTVALLSVLVFFLSLSNGLSGVVYSIVLANVSGALMVVAFLESYLHRAIR